MRLAEGRPHELPALSMGPRLRLAIVSSMFPRHEDDSRGTYVIGPLRPMLGAVEAHAVIPEETPLGQIAPRILGMQVVDQQQALSLPYLTVETVPFPQPPRLKGWSFAEPYLLLPFVWRALKRRSREVDVVHAHFAYPQGFATVLASRALGLPVVVTVHGSDVNLYANESRFSVRTKRRVQWTLMKAQHVICVSTALQSRIVELGVPGHTTSVIRNGYDPETFTLRDRAEARGHLGLPSELELVLYVGQLKPIKRLDVLLQAFGRVADRRPSARLAIVGSGALEGWIRGQVSALGLRGRVHLPGTLPPHQVALWMQACDVVALTSEHEGFPTVIPEALACGRPVVAVAVGGVPEGLSHGTQGLLARSHDPDQIALRLDDALEQDWNAERLRQSVSHLSWDRISDQILSVYARVDGSTYRP